MDMNKVRQSKGFLMAVSILTAVILWLYVDNKDEREITSQFITAPVEFIGESDILAERGLMVTDGTEVSVMFRLVGLREKISDINTKRDQFRVQVDLTDITAVGQHTRDYDIIFPNSVSELDYTVEQANPRTITVTVAQMSERQIPIRCEIVGEVPEGYMVDGSSIQPGRISISGLPGDVSKLGYASVKVDMTGVKESINEEFVYRLYDHDGNELDRSLYRTSSDTVQVSVTVLTIKSLPLEISFTEMPGSMRKNMAHSIFPSTITVAGDSKSLSTLNKITLATIDLSTITEDTAMEIPIPLPANSRLLDGADKAAVNISFIGLSTQDYVATNISFINPPEDRRVTLVTKEIDVTLRGPQEQLDLVSELNIRLIADLSEIATTTGNYAVPATVLVDGTDQVGAIGQYQLVVKVGR